MAEQTKILTGEDGLGEAVELLRREQCVALPTETVYGLAGLAASEVAVRKIFAAKGRPADHPLIVHLPSAAHLDRWAVNVPDAAYTLAAAFWPGPLTLLLCRHPRVSDVVTGGRDTIAVRVPAHPLFLEVLRRLDDGLAAPSANPYKQLSPTTAAQVVAGLAGRIPAVLDGGDCEFGLESTIVDLVAEQPAVLRSGPVSRQDLEAVLGQPVLLPESHDVAVPGNVEAHYQPRTPLVLVSTAALQSMRLEDTAVIVWSSNAVKERLSDEVATRILQPDPVAYGSELYRTLAALDQLGVSRIVVELPPQTEPWAAVNDRLQRAAGP